jgi:hypothetical protein
MGKNAKQNTLSSILRKSLEKESSAPFFLAHLQGRAAAELPALQEVSATVVSHVVERELFCTLVSCEGR